MGFFRFLLALSVFFSHSSSLHLWSGFGSQNAVELFFLISGFVMEKSFTKTYKSVRAFYFSRFLRVYPMYYSIIFLTAGLNFIFLSHNNQRQFFPGTFLGGKFILLSLVANFFIFTSDWLMFLGVDAHSRLQFGNSIQTQTPLYSLLWIAPIWSLGLELSYYIFVPVVARICRRKTLLLALFLLAVRGFFYAEGLNFDPWTYRFFFFEIPLFLLGASMAKEVARSSRYTEWSKSMKSKVSWPIQVIIVLSLYFLTSGINLAHLPRYLTMCLLVPITLQCLNTFRDSSFDVWLGKITYPFYLIHLPLIYLIKSFMSPHPYTNSSLSLNVTLVALVLSLGLAAGLEKVLSPLDEVRRTLSLKRRKFHIEI